MALLPTLDAHEELVRFCERRLRRVAERRAALDAEQAEADQAVADARRDRTDWIAANPDPQIMMF